MRGKRYQANDAEEAVMKSLERKQKVLFYCRCNSACSQMAEAFLNFFFPDGYEACSAGIKVTEIHPAVKRVMAEIGVDISGQRSKNVEEFIGTKFDCVATVCGDRPQECPFTDPTRTRPGCERCRGCCRFFPFFPYGAKVLHTRFQYSARLPLAGDETAEDFRKLRDDVRGWVIDTFG
jgi:arsenate reductase